MALPAAMPETVHDRVVRHLANNLRSDPNWLLLGADIQGFARPAPQAGRIPDLTAVLDGQLVHFEVETEATWASAQAMSQYLAFASTGRLVLYVPQGVEQAAGSLLSSLGIPPVVETY
jgi:hypothetical protein